MNLTQFIINNSIPLLFSLFFCVEKRTSANESNKINNSFIISLFSIFFECVVIIENKSLIISSSINIVSSLSLSLLEGSKMKAYLYL